MDALARWWHWLRPARRRPAAIAESAWREALAALPICQGFAPADEDRLRRRAAEFLADRIFERAGGAEPDEGMRLRIAILAALPVLELGIGWYDDWRTVIVYPGEFVRPRAELDPIGVMHEWEEALGGESWDRGPVVLSLADVEASGLGDGYNVVIHEMAHKLDLRNGAPDGFPPLPGGLGRREWTTTFSAAFADFNARLDAGEDTAIDPYAGEEPGEFFAVLSEYFFEQPDLVRAEYPGVYALLARFYGQDPAARLAGISLFNPPLDPP